MNEQQKAMLDQQTKLQRGAAIIVMLVDDGRGLEEPLDWRNVRSIEDLRVFERAIVQPDYSSLYNFHFFDTLETNKPFAEPEYYQVFSLYGYFTVHRSRCLVFRNGRLPEQTTNAIYRYWGIPEYVKIKRALRECITSHEDGVKLLERSVQAIYKMKNLANMLSTSDGEDKVLQRLQVIDMARGILNSIAIDNDGEDYDFKTLQMSGVKDVIDATCNMLSAVTNIPQTILFGRSPAGMNSTGDGDMENFYNMVENIQKQNMKKNIRTVIDLMLKQGKLEGRIPEVPEYKVKFAALWSMSDTEKADIDNKKANTEYTKAQTSQIYIDSSVVDPSEVRKSLATEGEMEIEEMLSEEGDQLELPEDTFDVGKPIDETITISGIDIGKDGGDTAQETICISGVDGDDDGNGRIIRILTENKQEETDGADYPAAAVIIIHNGKILCASIGRMDKDYNKTVSEYSDYDNDIKPKEFYEFQKKSMEGMTTEDFAILENSYYHSAEAYENSYVAYTNSKLGGQELNWAQKRMEQIVDEHSVEIPEGKTFFRKTSEEEFYALTGKRLSEFDNNAPASERTATIEKCTSFGTALQYDSFANANVMIEYVTKSGAKAFFSTNSDECEGILPPGTKITNITVKGNSNEKVPTIFRNTTSANKTGKEGALYYDSKAKVSYTLGSGNMDFTYSGKGVHNEWIKSKQSQQNYNPNYNNLTRVVVEVEG